MSKPPQLYTTINRSTPSQESAQKSIQRSRRELWKLVKNNQFDKWCTFTFKDDRNDIEKCRKRFSNWLDLTRKRRDRDLKYLVVPELHKSGAIHFHALMSGNIGLLVPAINEKTTSKHFGEPLKQNGRQVYTAKNYQLGFTTIVLIDQTEESLSKIGNYIGKYLTKDFADTNGFYKKRYWHSNNCVKPPTVANPAWWIKEVIKPVREPHNGTYGTLYNYGSDTIPLFE